MRNGNTHGFAVEAGTWTFNAGDTNTVTLSTAGTNGKVIADAVAFVKVPDNTAPTASNLSITGSTAIGGTLTGNPTYGDADGDAQGATQFQWYRNNDADFTGSEIAIPGATSQTYQVTTAAKGKRLVFRVTPVALTGVTMGNQISSDRIQIPITAKFIHNLAGGTPQKIVLYGTISENTGAWISLGFGQVIAPATTRNFTAANGVAHHGTVTWSDSVVGTLGTHTYTGDVNFGSILLSETNSSACNVSALAFRHTLNSDLAENVTYVCEWSTDLADWRSSGQLNNGGARVTVVSYPPDPNGMVTVGLTITEAPVQALFGRLSARQTP